MKVGIAGLGTIGLVVARALDDGIEGLELVAICVRDRDRAENKMAAFKNPAPVVAPSKLAEMSANSTLRISRW